MSKLQLLWKLEECAQMEDKEQALFDADAALIEYLNDPEIEAAYYRIMPRPA